MAMSEMKIHTNNVPRFTISSHELTPKEREEFDYLDWNAIDRGEDSREFVRYKGQLYDLGEFERTPYPANLPPNLKETIGQFARWDGYSSDSFFSGVLIRWARDEFDPRAIDPERVVVGWYSC